MSYFADNIDKKMLKVKSRKFTIMLKLLDESNILVDELSCDFIDGNRKVDSKSDIRRTCSINLQVKNNSYSIGEFSKFKPNRRIQILFGWYVPFIKDYRYYPYGTYDFTENTLDYDSSTNKLSINCVDLMNSVINTKIKHFSYYNAGEYNDDGNIVDEYGNSIDIRTVMKDCIVNECGINKYMIEDICPYYDNTKTELPNIISHPAGESIFEVIKECRDFWSGYETYFDDDVFVCRRIRNKEDNIPELTSDEFDGLVISESQSNNKSEIRNAIEIFGGVIDVDRYADETTYDDVDDVYCAIIPEFTEYINDFMIAIKVSKDNTTNTNIKINSLLSYPIYKINYVNGVIIDIELEPGELKEGRDYVFRYYDEKWYYEGQYQAHAISVLVNQIPSNEQQEQNKLTWNCNNISYIVKESHPYSIEKIGYRWDVFASGYESIQSDTDCLERAEYELGESSITKDTLNIVCVLIPWLDVNQKIEYKTQNGVESFYLIDSISDNFNGTMNLGLSKLY